MRNLIFLISLILFFACSNDDQEYSNQSKIDNKMLEGEWMAINSSGTYYTDIILSGSSWAKVSVIRNDVGDNSIVASDEGVWSWYSDNNSLAISTSRQSIPVYQVLDVTNDSLVMHNRSYNTTEAYRRVVESVELNAGDTTRIRLISEHADFSVDEIAISNPDLADVYKNGVIYGKQGGVGFVTINSGPNEYIVKITVTSRYDRYSKQMNLLIDDIYELYGEPDDISIVNISAFSTKNTGVANAYIRPKSDMELAELAYVYDSDTHIIYEIITIYGREITFDSDLSCMQKYYYNVTEPEISSNFGSYMFGRKQKIYENSYLVSVIYAYNDIRKYNMSFGYIKLDY